MRSWNKHLVAGILPLAKQEEANWNESSINSSMQNQTALSNDCCGPDSYKQEPFTNAWAAGFCDGEGSIFIFKQTYSKDPRRNPAYRLGLTISQNNWEVLEYFLEGVGVHGKIYRTKRTIGQNRQVYSLQYIGVDARNVIALLQPYLKRKQIEAQVALNYWKFAEGGRRPGPKGWPPCVLRTRERFYQKLKALK